jgi:hypothetical protein
MLVIITVIILKHLLHPDRNQIFDFYPIYMEHMQLQESAKALTNDMHQSTTRMLAVAEETVQIGNSTLEELDRQGKQLNRIDAMATNTINNATKAKAIVKDMERGFFASLLPSHLNWVKSRKSFAESKTPAAESRPTSKQPIAETRQVTSDHAEPLDKRSAMMKVIDRQLEPSLTELSKYLKIMKEQSIKMGEELDNHDEIISHIETTTTNAERIVNASTNRMRKI